MFFQSDINTFIIKTKTPKEKFYFIVIKCVRKKKSIFLKFHKDVKIIDVTFE
jgi:hypothetical protein